MIRKLNFLLLFSIVRSLKVALVLANGAGPGEMPRPLNNLETFCFCYFGPALAKLVDSAYPGNSTITLFLRVFFSL